MRPRLHLILLAACLGCASTSGAAHPPRHVPSPPPSPRGDGSPGAPSQTATPIKHLVIIFQENRSFDHYFGTYPLAANPAGEPAFHAAPGTPSVNGLTPALLAHNPNLSPPFRLGRLQSFTCDHTHDYVPEQKAYDQGLLDQFVQQIEVFSPRNGQYCTQALAGGNPMSMGYFDGNTVTALWNYAQRFAMSDNFYGTTFGPSTVGAVNLAGADNAGVICAPANKVYGQVPTCGPKGQPPGTGQPATSPNGPTATNYEDPDPFWDICSSGDASNLMAMGGRNIGDLLTAAGVTWGFFEGGFRLGADGKCSSRHVVEAYDRASGVDPSTDQRTFKNDYVPHHNPFQYYASTANPRHLPPGSVQAIGRTDQANHLYDLSDFWQAAEAGNVPAVTFLRAPAYQDGHAGYSDPLDEQQFLAQTINRLQKLPEWSSMAVLIAYDDSGGWYDHAMPPILNHSHTSLDMACGADNTGAPARCGYGPRLPLLAISPYARQNAVSHALTDQTSLTRFIEDNWLGGQRISAQSFDNLAGSLLDLFDFNQPPAPPLFLDPDTGLPSDGQAAAATRKKGICRKLRQGDKWYPEWISCCDNAEGSAWESADGSGSGTYAGSCAFWGIAP